MKCTSGTAASIVKIALMKAAVARRWHCVLTAPSSPTQKRTTASRPSRKSGSTMTVTAELGLWRDTKGTWWGVDPHTKKFFTLCTKDKEVATTRYNRMLD